MCRTEDGIVQYAPLCIHTFRLIAPRKLLEAQQFDQQYHSYEEIQNVPDRLRWCRHHMGLMQKEVAEQIGISRGHYIDYEVGYVDYYPKEVVDRLADFYHIPVEDLLDEYKPLSRSITGSTAHRPLLKWISIIPAGTSDMDQAPLKQ